MQANRANYHSGQQKQAKNAGGAHQSRNQVLFLAFSQRVTIFALL